MRNEGSATQGSLALPRRSGAEALAERLTPLAERLRALAPGELGAVWGRVGLGMLLCGAVAVVVFSTARGSMLSPRSQAAFPGWEAGPLHFVLGQPAVSNTALTVADSVLLALLVGAYGLALLAARSLSLRTIAIVVAAINLILLLGPPLQLTDLFNYLGYARLGALHGLNPYTHVMNAEGLDPVYRFTSWHNLHSPYGPLFTALTYPLAWLPLPVAYWMIKVATIACSLGFLWCVHRCAQLLGRDSRPVLVLVAANPIYLLFAVGAFHNDFFMLLPSMAAIALLLARRDRSAGAVLMLAVAVKFTAILLLPFLLMAARPPERRLRVIAGAVLGALPLLVLSLGLFGFSMPNLSEQSSVVTGYSVPNLLGWAVGLGGRTTGLMRVIDVLVVLVVLWGLRRRDWLAGAGWATIALIAGTSWLMPWYIVWALPLAALGTSARLRRTAVAFTVFLVLTFLPGWGPLMGMAGINPMSSPVGQAATTLQNKLQYGVYGP